MLWFLRVSVSVLLRNPIFWDFRGGGVGVCEDPHLPFWIRAFWVHAFAVSGKISYAGWFTDRLFKYNINPSKWKFWASSCHNFRTHQIKHIFGVPKRTISLRQFFWVHITYIWLKNQLSNYKMYFANITHYYSFVTSQYWPLVESMFLGWADNLPLIYR